MCIRSELSDKMMNEINEWGVNEQYFGNGK